MTDIDAGRNPGWNPAGRERLRHGLLPVQPYAALCVIAGILLGTLSTHPF